MVFPNAIHVAAKQYNNCHVLVEINDMGGQVADILHGEMEYENLLSSTMRGRKGQVLDGGFGSGTSQFGVRTTEVVKRTGCSILKSLIESWIHSFPNSLFVIILFAKRAKNVLSKFYFYALFYSDYQLRKYQPVHQR